MVTQRKTNTYSRVLCSVLSGLVFLGLFFGNTQALPSLEKDLHFIELQIDNPFMNVDGVTMKIDPLSDAAPIIVPSWKRSMIPLRGVLEHMGTTIEWGAQEKKITIYQEQTSTEIVLHIHQPKALVQGETCWIDEEDHRVSPFIIDKRAYVPVLFVGKTLHAKVTWYPKNKFISIQWADK
jgi:hypothetical protein